jgi:hypothetical protein
MRLQDVPPIRQLVEEVANLKRAKKFHKTIEGSLKWHHEEHDPQESRRTTPAKGEDILLQSVWMTEAYPPSLINDLLASFKKHGWDKNDRNVLSNSNLSDWIKQSRSTGNLSSWSNAGIILRPGDTRFSMGSENKRSKLPAVADYGYLSIRNITSSLTLVTVNFIIKPESVSVLNGVLAETYKTKVEHYPSRWHPKRAAYIDVAEQKRRAVNEAVNKVHEELYGWFRSNLPGYYSGTTPHKSLPTVDFITSTKYKYPKKDERQIKDTYFDLLFGRSSEIWNCQDITGLELRLPFGGRDESSITLFGNLKKLSKGTEKYGNGLNGMMQDHFDVTMGLWAAHNVLASYEQDLSAIRDQASSNNKTAKKTLDDLGYIRNEFLAISTDVQVVSKELLDTIKNSNRYYDSEKLHFLPPFYMPKGTSDFMELIRRRDEVRIDQLTVLENHVRDAVVSGGNIASAISNLRIQRYVFWLTVITAILAGVSVRSTIGDAIKAVHSYLVGLL